MFSRRRSARLLLIRNKTISESKHNISNVNHRDNVCYTEDNVLVYNLYVYNIPIFAKVNIKDFFSRYGEVHSVSTFHRKANDSRFGSVYINFKNAESAARALRKLDHMRFQIIRVEVAPSLQQQPPIMESNNENQNNDDTGKQKQVSYSILNLNDDCLLHIFSYLSFYQKFKMSGLCERFDNIFKISLRKVLNLNDFVELFHETTLFDIRQILIKYGNSIEHISFDINIKNGNIHRFITIVSKHCPYLKTIKLSNLRKISTIKHLANLKSISKLELIDCNINDKVCLLLSQLPELVSLNLSNNKNLTGKYLNRFEKLKHLEIELNRKTQNVTFEDMKNIEKIVLIVSNSNDAQKVADIPNLRSLTLKFKCFYGDINLASMIQKLAIKNKLETFCVPQLYLCDETKGLILTIRSIKRIIIQSNVDSEFIEKCAECNFLEYLCIRNNNFECPDAVVNLIKKSKSLQILHLDMPYSYYEVRFTNDNIFSKLILGIIDVMQQGERSRPFKLILSAFFISEFAVFKTRLWLKNLIPSSLSKIFQLSFERKNNYELILNKIEK